MSDWTEPPVLPQCAICGKTVTRNYILVALDEKEKDNPKTVCGMAPRTCLTTAFDRAFRSTTADFIWTNIVLNDAVKKGKKRLPIGLSKRYSVLKKFRFKCAACGVSASIAELQIDHIKPVSQGGSDAMENLQPLCVQCNLGKGGR